LVKNFPDLIRDANASLSRCQLVQHAGRLYVRSSRFPPKPGSKSKRPELVTGYRANPRELTLAIAVARQVDGALILGTFNWEPWLLERQRSPVTIGQWLQRLEKEYWQRREKTLKAQTTWSKSYWDYFQQLPLEQSLTVEVLKGVLMENYRAGTRSRQACSVAFGMLARFAGLERLEIAELGKGYKPAPKTAADILTDDQILFQLEQIERRPWQCAAALQAIFGLRNHEIFKADLSRVQEGIVRISADTKTGERVCYACPPQWIERFNLREDMPLPKVRTEGRSNRAIGDSVTGAYRRLNLSHPYAFRDAYAVRLEFYWDSSTPSAFKAKWMGHSSTVHDRNYLDAIQEMHHERMYAQLRRE
jgi:integrase